MSVTSVTNTVDTTGKTSSAGSTTTTELLDTDSFMNLLVTQLKYQDPLDPMETNEFMSQLAQLTQVERLQNIYDSLTDLETTIETGNLIDMIGKKIAVDGNTLSQGDEIEWPKPGGGVLRVRIEEVSYQPERAGVFHR